MIVIVIIGIISISAFGAYTTQQRRENQRTTLLYLESYLKRAKNSAIASKGFTPDTIENLELVSYGVVFKKSTSMQNAGEIILFSDLDEDETYVPENDQTIESYPLKSGLMITDLTGESPAIELDEAIVLYHPPRGDSIVKENVTSPTTPISEINLRLNSDVGAHLIRIYGATGVVDITKE